MLICSFRRIEGFSFNNAVGRSNRIFSSSLLRLHSSQAESQTDQKIGSRASAAVLQSQNQSVSSKIEISLNPPKGTRDFYPDDQRLKNWLFNIWRDVARRYGFEEYDAPVVEHVELYIRKAGEEVTQQLYDFTDKGGRKLSLRPEMTPSLARMILSKKAALSLPLKWYAIPQCWRYEKTTRGRRREHYQWNMDIFGIPGVEAEAELLSAIVLSFQQMGLSAKDVGIKINSRRILNDLMKKVGISQDKWIPCCVVVDKLEKVPLEALQKDIETIGVSLDAIKELTTYLKPQSLEEYESLLGNESQGIQDLRKLFTLLTAYGVVDWFQFDPTVVRGLAYYTGVVFEGFDRDGQFRAICGGGRYDQLLGSFANTNGVVNKNDNVPAVGFGYGDAVIVELLKAKNLLPSPTSLQEKQASDILAYAMTDDLRSRRLLPLIQQLRSQTSRSVDLVLEEKKVKAVFAKADKVFAKYVIFIGDEEDKRNEVKVKDLKSGQQFTWPLDQVVSEIDKLFKV